MEFSWEKQSDRPQNNSKPSQNRQPRFQIADNRPEVVWQAKMVEMISDPGENKEKQSSFSRPSPGVLPVQRKPWAGDGWVKCVDGDMEDIPLLENKFYKAYVYRHEFPSQKSSRSDIIKKMANKVATGGLPLYKEMLQDKWLRKHSIKKSGVQPDVPPIPVAPVRPENYRPNVQPPNLQFVLYEQAREQCKKDQKAYQQAERNLKDYNQNTDPFYLRLKANYEKDNLKKDLELTYQLSTSSYGYIVKIKEDANLYNMHPEPGKDTLKNKQKEVALAFDSDLFRRYPSGHQQEKKADLEGHGLPTTIKNQADGDFTEDAIGFVNQSNQDIPDDQVIDQRQDALNKRSLYLDAITKLGGEGARFKCVREHHSNLTDETVFYCKKGLDYKGITLPELWGMWGEKFEYAFNIDNETIKDKAEMKIYPADQLKAGRDFDLDNDKAKQ